MDQQGGWKQTAALISSVETTRTRSVAPGETQRRTWAVPGTSVITFRNVNCVQSSELHQEVIPGDFQQVWLTQSSHCNYCADGRFKETPFYKSLWLCFTAPQHYVSGEIVTRRSSLCDPWSSWHTNNEPQGHLNLFLPPSWYNTRPTEPPLMTFGGDIQHWRVLSTRRPAHSIGSVTRHNNSRWKIK